MKCRVHIHIHIHRCLYLSPQTEALRFTIVCVIKCLYMYVCMYAPALFTVAMDWMTVRPSINIGSSSFSDLVYADDTVFFVKDATVAPTLAIDPSCLNLRPFRTRQTNSTAGVRSNQNSDTILVSFYRAMLCIRGTSHGPVSVCLSVCPSDTSQCSTKTAKRRITKTTPHDSPGTLVY